MRLVLLNPESFRESNIAVIFYNVMTKGIEFVEQGIKLYEQKIWHSHHYVKRTTVKVFTKTSKTLWAYSFSSTTGVSSLAALVMCDNILLKLFFSNFIDKRSELVFRKSRIKRFCSFYQRTTNTHNSISRQRRNYSFT